MTCLPWLNTLTTGLPQPPKFYRKDLIDELKIFGMSSRHHIDDFMRGQIIGKIEEGRKITDVAREFDIAHSVVSRLWKSFKTTGMCSRRHGEVVLEQVANQFLAASGKQISRKTVARRLRGGGLYARRPVVCVPLTRQHRTARLQWCREHHNWTEQDWACVLFSDESRLSLSSDCRRQLIWRESGTAYRPENIQEKDRYPTCSVMVWAGIMINGRTRLHVVANGTMTGQRYIDEVLLPHVRLFRGAGGDKFVFMDDNATCHRTLAVQDCLDSEGIQRLVWPARSPDLNPIENVWDALGRQVSGRNYPTTNKNTLNHALTEEWDKLPQQLLDNVVQNLMYITYSKTCKVLGQEVTGVTEMISAPYKARFGAPSWIFQSRPWCQLEFGPPRTLPPPSNEGVYYIRIGSTWSEETSLPPVDTVACGNEAADELTESLRWLEPGLDLRRRRLCVAYTFKILSIPSYPLQSEYMSTSMKRLVPELDLPNVDIQQRNVL
ncbi:transposable element Tcb2 transposase [Trichonephila clavipes]|nr:transposable element Tcb2 transposase [Trichonephila clavipes]